jgi:hypothetical protein
MATVCSSGQSLSSARSRRSRPSASPSASRRPGRAFSTRWHLAQQVQVSPGRLAENFEDLPLTASVTVSVVAATSPQGGALNTEPAAIASSLQPKQASGPTVAITSGSSPVLDLAGSFFAVFDAITSTFRFVGRSRSTSEGVVCRLLTVARWRVVGSTPQRHCR